MRSTSVDVASSGGRAVDRRSRGKFGSPLGQRIGVAFCALVVVILAGCGGGGGNDQPTKKKQTLTIGVITAPASLDPAKTEPNSGYNLSLTYAPLIHQKADGSLSPGLATSWGYVGTGNKSFKLTLRPDAKFSDGTPVDAQAVKKWITYFPKPGYSMASMLGPVTSIDTPDQSTVVINLKEPNPILPTLLSEAFNWGYVASPKLLAKPALLAKRSAGAGPYVLVPSETVNGDHYTYVPNKYFYDQKAIRFKKVVVKVIPKAASMLAAIQTGQVDVALGDPITAKAAKSAGLKIVAAPTFTASFVVTDLAGKLVPALGDVRVRQALSYAINRSSITKALVGEYGIPTSQFVTTDGFDPQYQDYYSYDPNKAKALLKEAGYEKGFSFKMLSASFTGNVGDPLTQAVARDFANIGVKMEIVPQPTDSAFNTAIFSGRYPGFGLLYGGDPMKVQYGFYYGPHAPFNQHGWRDPTLDALYQKALSAPPDEGGQYWKAMSARNVTQAQMICVVSKQTIMYVSKRIGGVAFSSKAPTSYPTTWFPT